MAGSAGWAARDQGEERLWARRGIQTPKRVGKVRRKYTCLGVRLALGGWEGAKLSYSYSLALAPSWEEKPRHALSVAAAFPALHALVRNPLEGPPLDIHSAR